MTEFLAQVSLLEAISVGFAAAYLILAIRQNPLCWVASFVSAVLAIFVFLDAQLFMQSALWAFFACMAVYGWLQWTRRNRRSGSLAAQIHTWPARNHFAALAGTLVCSAAFAWALSGTSQALPFVDSLVTVASILTTWMVAKKLLENWVYWFVIDCISIYLFLSQGVLLYAGLYVVYLVLVVIGYRQWRADLRRRDATGGAIAEPG